jgi:ABC-type branched-subunit amino acid transport system substrate-binding protein
LLLRCFFLFTFFASSALATEGKIGFGSAVSTMTARTQVNVYMGFELGLREVLGKEIATRVLVTRQESVPKQLGAMEMARELVSQNVAAVFGFSGSHDSLLAGRVLRDKKMLTLFPGSNHNDIRNFGKYVYTTGHSMDTEVSNTLDFIRKHYIQKKGLAIINLQAAASHSIDKILTDQLPALAGSVKMEKLFLDKNLTLSQEALDTILNSKYDYMYFTAYPEAMVPFVAQIEKMGLDLPIIAASSWGLEDAEVIRRFIAQKSQPLFISSNWHKESQDFKRFVNLFKKNYGREPIPENSLGYDVGVIAGKAIKGANGKISREGLYQSFIKQKCFSGLSVGRICFPAEGGHSDLKPRFYKVSSKGFIPVQ